MKNESSGVKILGWSVIISSLVTTVFYYFVLEVYGTTLFLWNFFSSMSIFPRGLLWFLSSFDHEGKWLPIVIEFWRIIVIICGIGILRLNNTLRILLIILCCIHIPTYLLSRLLISLYEPYPLTLIHFLGDTSVVWFPAFYIVLLTRPKVKEQFK